MQAEVITGAVGLFLIQEAIVLFTFEKVLFYFILFVSSCYEVKYLIINTCFWRNHINAK